MNALEHSMFSRGWVRCPNNAHRWYAGSAGKQEPVFPLELRVTDAVWLVTSRYGEHGRDIIPLMRFNGPDDLEQYLKENGRRSEAAAAFSNSWD